MTSRKFEIGLASLLMISLALCASAAVAEQKSAGTYLWMSDIHFDPFYPYTYKDTRSQSQVESILEKLVDRSDPTKVRWKVAEQWPIVFGQTGFQGADFSQPGADTNHKLLQTVLDTAQKSEPDADFMVITGDFLGHGFGYNYSVLAPADLQSARHYQSFVNQTLRYIAQSVHARFKSIRIYATLGNNDAYCGDYDLHLDRPNSAFLEETVEVIFESFLTDLSTAEKQNIRSSYLDGGYFAASLPAPSKNRIFVLNSIPFMARYPDNFRSDSFPPTEKICAASQPVDAKAEMAWLEKQLASSSFERAWIAAHVPPGIDCYSGNQTWSNSYLTPYQKLFSTSIAQKLATTMVAHTHMAEFKLLRSGNDVVSFVLLGPSISPVHKNNPSFRAMHYDRQSLAITDYETHYISLVKGSSYGQWSSFTFSGSYPGLDAVNAASLNTLYGRLTSDKKTLQQYAENYNSRADFDASHLMKNYRSCIGSLTGMP